MQRKFALSLALMFCLSAVAQAASITVGTWSYAVSDPGVKQIPIFVTGNEVINGVQFNAQVADSGPDAIGSIVGPKIVSDASNGYAILAPGTLFQPNNNGASDPYPGHDFGYQVLFVGTLTNSGTIQLNGTPQLLATLFIDTTGIAPGVYALNLGDTVNGSSAFTTTTGSFEPQITDGFINIVPEPASVVMGMFGAVAVGAVAIRRARRNG